MDGRMPRRVIGEQRMRAILAEHLGRMEAIVESRHISLNGEPPETSVRRLKQCVAVLVWEEPDGSERTEIVGDEGGGHLNLKGLLHDAIYLLAHADEDAPR